MIPLVCALGAGLLVQPAAPATAVTTATSSCTVDVDLRRGSTLTHLSIDTARAATSAKAVTVTTERLTASSPVAGARAAITQNSFQEGLQMGTTSSDTYSVTSTGRLVRTAKVDWVNVVEHKEGCTRQTTVIDRGLTRPRSIAAGSATPTTHLYVLDGGTLRRYTAPANGGTMRASGIVSGYSTYRGLTVLRTGTTGDVLLATTTRGSLVTITVPAGRFAPRVTTLRKTGWAHIDALSSTAPCDANGTSGLIGVDSRRGIVQPYTLRSPRTSPDRITLAGRGTLPTRYRADLVIPRTFTRV